MDLKTQLEIVAKNHQASIQNLEKKFDRLVDKQSGRPSRSLPSNTQPNPRGSKAYQPLQAHNEHVNTIFTRSGKSYNPLNNPDDQQNKSENPINFDSDEPTPQPKTQPTKSVKETPLPKPYKPKIPDESSAMIQNKVPPKLGDPESFLIPCNFNKTFSCNALADLGASINLMPYSLYAKLSLETLKPTKMSVRLADRSFQYPVGIAKNMLIEVGKFTFPADFVILEMEEDNCDFHEKRIAKHVELNKKKGKGTGQGENRPDDLQKALKKKGIVDSGCSRHMTRNKAYLVEYQDYNGVPIAFRGSKGQITGKGKIITRNLDFNDVYFMKELKQFNLFYVSQMCDKKNKVLFTDSECLVLSLDFKLPDENQVLLRVPRQNNMYSFNLENIVPTGGLACLIAKAIVDESNKWHRRLGHVNFKNLNKLEKGNLVRGLPSKIFQNDHTCVVCQKGKQYNASCKAKVVNSISQPLQLLRMDLFRPTSIRSINHKTYCLVITDDFSRFSWVFFLRTKDETNGILKDFIRQIENQLNQKVKTISCDNGTKFKNMDIIEFYGSKGIKREYSNARTPQQNRVAQRKNRTLIEPARTMLADSLLPNTFWAEAVSTAGGKLSTTWKGPNWLFDLDYLTDSMNYQLVTVENKANKTVGPKEANHSVVKSSETNNGDEKPNEDTDPKTNEKPKDQEDQAFLEELESPSSVFSTGGPDLTNNDQDDSQIPTLEDIYDNSTDGIFTNESYVDEGKVVEFTNLETTMNVSPIPTSRIHSIHPTTQILGDPTLAVLTRSIVNKSTRALAFVSYIQKQRRNNHKDFQHCLFACFLSQIEPKNISQALKDER
ncbi:putative ribonuclease H-like domain-containing protein [Tanacetum coccineum]